jgi:hypothetical protein
MKINVTVDCSPEEARAFLGLPDVRPMQEMLMQEMQDRMSSSLRAMQPDELFKLWMPANLKLLEQMSEAFLRMGGGPRG